MKVMQPEPKFPPIVLDRSRLEQYATCPYQGYLSILWEAMNANATGYEVFSWEEDRVRSADPELLAYIKARALNSHNSQMALVGTEIHDLIDKAFAVDGAISDIPDWLVKHLPKLRPDLSDEAFDGARFLSDHIANIHINIVGIEEQLSHVIIKETSNSPAVKVSMRYDLFALGKDNSNLHIIDWKTGRKKWNSTETEASFQAQCGAWLLWQQPVYKEINLIHFFYYMPRMSPKPSYARFERNFEVPSLPHLTTELKIRGRILEAVKLCLGNVKVAWPEEKKCLWCDFTRCCKYAHVAAREIADDPKKFIDEMLVMKVLLKKRGHAATQYYNAHGPIKGTKQMWAPNAKQTRSTCGFQDIDKPKSDALTGNAELDSHFRK
jgi:hypothetical protein